MRPLRRHSAKGQTAPLDNQISAWDKAPSQASPDVGAEPGGSDSSKRSYRPPTEVRESPAGGARYGEQSSDKDRVLVISWTAPHRSDCKPHQAIHVPGR